MNRRASIPPAVFRLARTAVGLGILATIWRQTGQADDLRVEKRTLKLPRWDADGFRVAFLADFHADFPQARKRAARAIDMALAAKPDVLLLGGDYISSTHDETYEGLDRLVQRMADSGIPVFGVLGNHDRKHGQLEDLLDALHNPRVRMLHNERAEVDGVVIAGIDDGIHEEDRHDFLLPGDDKNVVAVFHEPDFVERIDKRCALMLAGHSHGGQICLPTGQRFRSLPGARRYRSGFYPSAPVPLYVTRGVGTIGPDFRLFCPPEVSVLTLRGL